MLHRSSPPPRLLTRPGLLGGLLAVAFVALAGCGEEEHGVRTLDTAARDRTARASVAGIAPTHRVDVTVRQGAYAFDEPAAVAAAGRVSVTIDNPTGVWHNVAVLDTSKPAPKGMGAPAFLGLTPILPATSSNRFATDTTVVDLEPGRYRLVCIVEGHSLSGMDIPLEVVDAPEATDRPLPNSAEALARNLPANSVTITRPGPEPRFDKTEATARAGRVGFRFVNRSPVPSDLAVIGADGTLISPDSPVMGAGEAGFVVDLPRGEYTLTNLPDAKNMTIPLHVR